MSFEETFNTRIEMYLLDRNVEPNEKKHSISKNGADVPSYISKWLYDIPEPSIDELKAITETEIEAYIEEESMKNKLKLVVPVLTTDKINKIKQPKEGSIVYNKSTNKLTVFADNEWK